MHYGKYGEFFDGGTELPYHADAIEQSEEMRKYKACALGLAEDASWDEIADVDDQKLRQDSARVLGLSKDAGWEEIHKAEGGEGDRISRALLLGLSRDTGISEVVTLENRKLMELLKQIAAEMKRNEK